MDRIVMTAERLKPESASCGVSTLLAPSATSNSRATRSARSHSVTSSTDATKRKSRTRTASADIGV